MKTATRPLAGTASFAHLIAPTRAARPARADEDPSPATAPAETEEERDEELQRREDAGEDTGETEEERAKRHERQDARRGPEPVADTEEESDREEMRGGGPIASARLRERARCAAIFACPAAGNNPAVAAHMAFRTNLTRGEAIDALGYVPTAAAAPRGVSRPDRAAANPALGSGGGPGTGGPAHSAQLWDRVMAKVSPATKH